MLYYLFKRYCKILFYHYRLRYLSITKEESKLILQLIDRYYEKRRTIIAANMNFSQWDDVFGDSLINSTIVNILLHHSHVVKITENSYRLKDFFQKENE